MGSTILNANVLELLLLYGMKIKFLILISFINVYCHRMDAQEMVHSNISLLTFYGLSEAEIINLSLSDYGTLININTLVDGDTIISSNYPEALVKQFRFVNM